MRGLSLFFQLLSLGMVIYLINFKSEITPKDVLIGIFFTGTYLLEEIRQLKMDLKENNNNIKNED